MGNVAPQGHAITTIATDMMKCSKGPTTRVHVRGPVAIANRHSAALRTNSAVTIQRRKMSWITVDAQARPATAHGPRRWDQRRRRDRTGSSGRVWFTNFGGFLSAGRR